MLARENLIQKWLRRQQITSAIDCTKRHNISQKQVKEQLQAHIIPP